MLTGHRAFDGDGVSDTLAHGVMKEPDWSRLPGDTPAAIRRLLRHCLAKEQRNRLADISDARLELLERPPLQDSASSSHRTSARVYALWAFATLAVAGAAFFFGLNRGTQS